MASNLVPANIAGVAFPASAETISAAGPRGAQTFLRGDGSWAIPETEGEGVSLPFSKTRVKTKALTKNDGLHHTFYVMTVALPDGRWMMFSRITPIAHSGVDLNASIYTQVTKDKGTTWTNPVAIYNGGGVADPRGLVAKLMGNGRIGLIVPRCPEVGTYISPAFIWSDDGGATWSSKIITEAAAFSGASADIYRYPASVGGHDTLGFIAYSASGHSTTNVMVYVKTEDNGETWQSGTAMPNVPGVELSSLGVARIGTDNRWIALVRDADTSGPLGAANERNGLCYKSTNMLTWSGPYDTGQNINNNPHVVTYHDGTLYWMVATRKFFDREINPSAGHLVDGFLHQWADADDLWTGNLTSWPGWSDLVALPGTEGHPVFFRDGEGSLYATFGFRLKGYGEGRYSTVIGVISNTSLSVQERSADIGELGTAAYEDVEAFATAQQGGKADSAVQPETLSPVATSGSYSDLIGVPAIDSGTWTPSITLETLGDLSVVDGSVKEGSWFRIDDLVTVTMTYQFTATYTTASGKILIGGLPFEISSGGTIAGAALLGHNSNLDYPAGTSHVKVTGIAASKTVRLIAQGNGSVGAITHEHVGSGAQQLWDFQIIYRTDD